MHHCAEVAAVAQVSDACVPRAVHRLQLHARLLDHLPFTDPRPGVIVCVVPILGLKSETGELSVKTSVSSRCLVHSMWVDHGQVVLIYTWINNIQSRQLTLLCICSMSIPKCDKCSDMWGSNTASSSSNEYTSETKDSVFRERSTLHYT